MKVNGKHYRSIWFDGQKDQVKIIDQRLLPYEFKIISVESLKDFEVAIKDMAVRGAPLIGATAAFGVARQMLRDPSDDSLQSRFNRLIKTRPTAINLKWALDKCREALMPASIDERGSLAMNLAQKISDEDVEINRNIGLYGLDIIKEISDKKPTNEPVRLLTPVSYTHLTLPTKA